MAPFRKLKFGPAEMIVLFVLGLLALIIATGNFHPLLNVLFSKIAVLILIIMLFEYLLLKGSDRSDIYRRELEAARQKRRDDLLALREMETRLIALRHNLETVLHQIGEEGARQESNPQLHAALTTAHATAQSLHDLLRERI